MNKTNKQELSEEEGLLTIAQADDSLINWWGKYPGGYSIGHDSESGQSTSSPIPFGQVAKFLFGAAVTALRATRKELEDA